MFLGLRMKIFIFHIQFHGFVRMRCYKKLEFGQNDDDFSQCGSGASRTYFFPVSSQDSISVFYPVSSEDPISVSSQESTPLNLDMQKY